MIAEKMEAPTPCPHCDGDGFVRYIVLMSGTTEDEVCEYCAGSGHVLHCDTCGAELELVRAGKFQCPNCG